MEIKIADNIRLFRKSRKMTQEQLSEALGVTVGAVSKWESGMTTPELGLIVEMAEFFETSVDVLLGYQWQKGTMGKLLERLKALRNDRKFDEAALLAEKLLQKFPNSFDVAYQSAMAYFLSLTSKHQRRAIELFERALELIEQNTDDTISVTAIQNMIAKAYLILGETEAGLEILKKYNVEGLNDAQIGIAYAIKCHDAEKALPYLSDAMGNCATTLFQICTGFTNAYAQRREYDKAIDALRLLLKFNGELKTPGTSSYLERGEVAIYTGCAILYATQGDRTNAYAYLKRARVLARQFDAAPEYSLKNMKYYHGTRDAVTFDDFGETAMNGIRYNLSANPECTLIQEIWHELEREEAQSSIG